MARRVAYTFVAKDQFTRVAKAVGRQTKGLRDQFKGLTKDLKETGKSIKGIGEKTRTMSVVATAAIAVSLKAFGDLEAGMITVLTLLGDDTKVRKFRGEIKNLRDEALRLGFGVEETNQALFNQLSQISAGPKSFDAFRQAMRLAIGGNATLDTSVRGVANVMNAYGVQTTNASEVINAFFASQVSGSRDVEALASNIGRVAGEAADAGVPLTDLLATMAQLTKSGLSQEQATTGLLGAINAMTASTGKSTLILEGWGIASSKSTLRTIGLVESFRNINKLNEKFPDTMKEAITSQEAMRAVTNLTSEALDSISETVTRIGTNMKDGTGLTNAFERQMGTFNRSMKQAKGSTTLAADAMGKKVSPAFLLLGSLVTAASDGFVALGPTAQGTITALVVAIALLSPVLTVVGAAMVFAGSGALFFGAIFSGIGLAVVATGALIIGSVVAIVQNWDFLIAKAVQLKNTVSGFVGGLLGFGDSDMNVTGTGTLSQASQTDINVSLNAPKGVIRNVKSATTGQVAGLSIGVNMAEQLA